MLWGWFMLSLAFAGTPEVTLNGVDIRTLRDTRFKQVDVYIDADGNVHLTSDRYEVQVEQDADAGGMKMPPRPAQPAPAPEPVAASQASPPPSTATAGPRVAPDPTRVPAARVKGAAVASGTWWLATEDNGSRGHEVRVYINGSLVKTVQSGQPQVIHDVSDALKVGPNDVMLLTRSLSPSGGGFYVYLGKGENRGGSVTLAQPDIQHGLGASRKGEDVRKFTLVVE